MDGYKPVSSSLNPFDSASNLNLHNHHQRNMEYRMGKLRYKILYNIFHFHRAEIIIIIMKRGIESKVVFFCAFFRTSNHVCLSQLFTKHP